MRVRVSEESESESAGANAAEDRVIYGIRMAISLYNTMWISGGLLYD